jgi:formylglycine-generating enzyme
VTQEAYQRVMGKNPSHFRRDRLPVEQVSWHDARAYCEAVGMQLPTEAEWEYVARAGNPADRYGRLDEIAWYAGNSEGETHEVGQKQPNAFDLSDTLGNVWEWTADWFDGKYYASYPPPANWIDPKGPATSGRYRALRGGSWVNFAGDARASDRLRLEPGFRYDFVGVRCAGD